MRRRFCSRLLGWLAASLLAIPAGRADAAEVRPPTRIDTAVVSYPVDAEGDAVVRLLLLIAPDGKVAAVTVAEGREPFASQALAAARAFLFSPATSDGRPVRARIQLEIAFDAPVPAPPPPATSPAELEPLEVTVTGEPVHAAPLSLTTAEVTQLPGAFGDPFRAVEALPGVTPIASGIPFFFVRGAPPGNVGYFLDGVDVPVLFHVGAGPSVVHPGLVDRIDFYPGNFPVRYGRYAGGIITAETTAPARDFHGRGNARLFDVGALVEGEVTDGVVALAGGRYSYAALILSAVSPDIDVAYWDYQARIAADLNDDDRVSVFAFGSSDFLADTESGEQEVVFDTSFHRVDVRLDRRLPDRGKVRVASTLGWDQTFGEGVRTLIDRSYRGRLELEQPLGDGWTVEAGADLRVDRYETRFNRNPCLNNDLCPDGVAESLELGTAQQLDNAMRALFPSRTDLTAGVYAGLRFPLGPRLTADAGTRVDAYASLGETAVGIDPRVSLTAEIAPDTRLIPAVGIVHQLPSFLPAPGFQIAGIVGGLQRALQTSLSFEAPLFEDLEGRITVFRNAIFGLTDPLGGTRGAGVSADRFTTRSTGVTTGLEVFVKRPLTERIGGFLSYTLSRSTRRLEADQPLTQGAYEVPLGEVPSAYDRTHVLSAALSYRFGDGWSAGVRYVFYTGFPEDEINIYETRRTDPDRVPPFYRFDARLAKTWELGDEVELTAALELFNAFFQSEIFDVACDASGCEPESVGPVTVPSLGAEIVF